MSTLTGKTMVVIGGSRGVGRRIVEAAIRKGARVLAVARQEGPLRQLAEEVPGAEVLALDATDEGAPAKVFDVLRARYPGSLRRRIAAGRAAPRAELAGVRRQLGDRRQNRISLLQGGAVATAARGHFGHSDLQRRRSRRLAEFGRLCRRQTHADVHGELQPEGIGSSWARLAIHGACAAHHAGHRARTSMRSPAIPAIWVSPRRTSFRAWRRRRPRPMSRPRSSRWRTIPEQSKGKVFVVSGKGLEAALA